MISVNWASFSDGRDLTTGLRQIFGALAQLAGLDFLDVALGFHRTLTSGRCNATLSGMSLPKRATVYFEPEIHRALRLKAAATDRSISDMVNDAVKLALAEDAEDLAAFEERAQEKSVDFGTVVRSLRRRGKI